jgi:hypothetical protein
VIFLSGALAGGALTLAVTRRAALSALRQPQLVPEHLAARMRSRLNLSPEQEAAVARILAERQAGWRAVRRSVRPQVDAELERLHDEVAALLSPEQVRAWDRWFERLRARWLLPEEEPRPRPRRPHGEEAPGPPPGAPPR